MEAPATQRTPTKDVTVLGAEAMLASIVDLLFYSNQPDAARLVAAACGRTYIQTVVREARQHADFGGYGAWRQGGKP